MSGLDLEAVQGWQRVLLEGFVSFIGFSPARADLQQQQQQQPTTTGTVNTALAVLDQPIITVACRLCDALWQAPHEVRLHAR